MPQQLKSRKTVQRICGAAVNISPFESA